MRIAVTGATGFWDGTSSASDSGWARPAVMAPAAERPQWFSGIAALLEWLRENSVTSGLPPRWWRTARPSCMPPWIIPVEGFEAAKDR